MQSRLRGVTLMALSNKFGALVLTTGNKSEVAVGYCTLYGDMNGGLAVIVGRIDNVPITNPTALQMHFAMMRVDNGFALYNSSFTLIGYADGVAKGSHTLSFIYDNRQGPLGNIEYSCFVDSDPFFIEIVETS